MLDRRLGKQAVTKYRPHDFLHPGWSDDSGEEEEHFNDLRPLPASADKLNDCSAEHALLWLHTVACTPLERPKVRHITKLLVLSKLCIDHHSMLLLFNPG